MSVRPASSASTRAPTSRMTSIVVVPDRRHVEAQILRRLAHLHDHDAAAPELAAAADRGVGALDPLDGEHGAALHDHALADVPAADLACATWKPEADVVPLARRAARCG